MKILVTGATGRIGHHLVDELLKGGHTVRALVMQADPLRSRVKKPGVEIVEGSLTDRAGLIPAVEGVDAVYHLGALLPQGQTADALFEVNVRGTYNLLEAVLPHAGNIKRFVMASTDNVYWNRNGALYLPIDENHPRINDDPYGISKILCEDLCWGYMHRCGLPVAMPRFGVTLECHELPNPEGIFAGRFFLKPILAGLKTRAHPTDLEKEAIRKLESEDTGEIKLVIVRDPSGMPATETINDARNVAQGLLLFLEKECAVGEVFHIMAPYPFAHDEYVKYKSRVTGWPYVETVLPAVIHWELSIAKARTMLGYDPKIGVFQMIDEGWEVVRSRFS